MSENILVFEHLQVEFLGRKVLGDVCASVPEGGLTVFVGPNGAGKTTLLLCIMGEVPYHGRIRFSPGVEGHVGYVPQHLHAQTSTPITCTEFLSLNAARRPVWLGIGAQARRAIAAALDSVGLPDSGPRCIGELSGGEMRRVLLASALLRRPRLLLLDEPAAGVDMRGERLFWEILNEVRIREHMSVVMVSHNLSLAAHYATHVVCVAHGHCQEGSAHQVFTAENLMSIFGVPIHIYPDQCAVPHHLCSMCGAFGEAGVDHPAVRQNRQEADR